MITRAAQVNQPWAQMGWCLFMGPVYNSSLTEGFDWCKLQIQKYKLIINSAGERECEFRVFTRDVKSVEIPISLKQQFPGDKRFWLQIFHFPFVAGKFREMFIPITQF